MIWATIQFISGIFALHVYYSWDWAIAFITFYNTSIYFVFKPAFFGFARDMHMRSIFPRFNANVNISPFPTIAQINPHWAGCYISIVIIFEQ